MKDLWIDRLKLFVRSGLNAVGLDVIPAHKGPNFPRRRLLERVKPDLVVDVGANSGQHAYGLRALGYRGRILSLEPLTRPFQVLQQHANRDPHWQCLKVAAGAANTRADMHVAGNSVSSSLLPMAEQHVVVAPESKVVGAEQVEVVRLDSLSGVLWPREAKVWLKIDVQGTEADVLEGTRECIEQVEVIDVELSLAPLYEGQRLMPEMMELVQGLGFDLVSLQTVLVDRTSGEALQMDGLFVRRERGA